MACVEPSFKICQYMRLQEICLDVPDDSVSTLANDILNIVLVGDVEGDLSRATIWWGLRLLLLWLCLRHLCDGLECYHRAYWPGFRRTTFRKNFFTAFFTDFFTRTQTETGDALRGGLLPGLVSIGSGAVGWTKLRMKSGLRMAASSA